MRIPAPHLSVDDFLSPEENEGLLSWAVGSESRFQPRALDPSIDDPDRWRCLKLNDLGPFDAVFRRRIAERYKEFLKAMRLSSFEPGDLEFRMAAYKDGGSFAYHLDSRSDPLTPEHSRMLTGVYYFHHRPQRFTGGAIRLFDLGAAPESNHFRELPPTQNSLLLFPSWVGHQVMPIACETGEFADSRFAVNCWLHRSR